MEYLCQTMLLRLMTIMTGWSLIIIYAKIKTDPIKHLIDQFIDFTYEIG